MWKVAILGFFATALIIPMPVVKNANHFKIGVIGLLGLFLWETYYTWGVLMASIDYVMFWPIWSTLPSVMVLYMTYLAWNYLSSPEGFNQHTQYAWFDTIRHSSNPKYFKINENP